MTTNGKAYRLTERQAKFTRFVAGGMTATQAAKDAGYGKQYANREAKLLLDKPQIQRYLAELTEKIAAPDIADASKRQKFWTGVMDDAEAEMKDRLKASELLGRAQGDFVEQRRHTGSSTDPIVVRVVREEAAVARY